MSDMRREKTQYPGVFYRMAERIGGRGWKKFSISYSSVTGKPSKPKQVGSIRTT